MMKLQKKAVLLSLGLHLAVACSLVAHPGVTLVQPSSTVVQLTLQPAVAGISDSSVRARQEDREQDPAPSPVSEVQYSMQTVPAPSDADILQSPPQTASFKQDRETPLSCITAGSIKQKISKKSVPVPPKQEKVAELQPERQLQEAAGIHRRGDTGEQETVNAHPGLSFPEALTRQEALPGVVQESPAGHAEQQYLSKHFEHIRQRILDNLVFPGIAKRMRWSGRLVVSFIIKTDGKVEQVRVESGSGHTILDSQVVATIYDIQPYPFPPVQAKLRIPVTFSFVN